MCSVVSDSVAPWTVAHQAHLSMGFSRQEYWSGLPRPPPGDLPDLWQHTRPDFERRLWDLYMRGTWRKGEEGTSMGRGSVKCPQQCFLALRFHNYAATKNTHHDAQWLSGSGQCHFTSGIQRSKPGVLGHERGWHLEEIEELQTCQLGKILFDGWSLF